MKFILRWAINTVALYVAIILLPHNIILQGTWISIIWLALIFGLVNAILRPPFKALTCLLIILTLGLFTLVLNALMILLVGHVVKGFEVHGLLNALVLSLIVAVVHGLVATGAAGALSTTIPDPLLAKAMVPVRLVPIRLPWTTLSLLPSICTPYVSFPLTTLPGPPVAAPSLLPASVRLDPPTMFRPPSEIYTPE